jgi:hypothetical protein
MASCISIFFCTRRKNRKENKRKRQVEEKAELFEF